MAKTWRRNGLSIAYGNTKLGSVPTISLMPGLSCPSGVPCYKDGCYALRMASVFTATVPRAWKQNLWIAKTMPGMYFATVCEFVSEIKPPFFRWHSGGDIPEQSYYHEMDHVARLFEDVKFLVFTKRYRWVREIQPPNLSVVLSAWPGYPLWNPHGLPVAWLDDGTDQRIPDDALECNSHCDTCTMCWHLKELGRDVVFPKRTRKGVYEG